MTRRRASILGASATTPLACSEVVPDEARQRELVSAKRRVGRHRDRSSATDERHVAQRDRAYRNQPHGTGPAIGVGRGAAQAEGQRHIDPAPRDDDVGILDASPQQRTNGRREVDAGQRHSRRIADPHIAQVNGDPRHEPHRRGSDMDLLAEPARRLRLERAAHAVAREHPVERARTRNDDEQNEPGGGDCEAAHHRFSL